MPIVRYPWIGPLLLISSSALGAEMAGAPPLTVPTVQSRVEFLLSNDVFGRGGDVDDFRTQQLLFSAAAGERWRITLDHSILTLDQEGLPQGRLDQLSGSLAYELIDQRSKSWFSKLSIGGGLRISGELEGAPIQNGVHRIFDSSIVDLPYVGTERTDLLAWVRGERFKELSALAVPNWLGGVWETGYWLHGTTLITSDGQWDGTAGALLSANKSWFEVWLGLRGDWRSGYHRDPVQRFTAANEQGAYLTFGLRMGPLLIETNQGFNDDAAFGRISLISGIGPGLSASPGASNVGVVVAASIPEVYANVQFHAGLCGWLSCSERHRWAAVIAYAFGEPPDGNSTTQFVDTRQLSAGLEIELRPDVWPDWINAYGHAGLGRRQERLVGEGALAGMRSSTVDQAVAVGELGLRFAALRTDRWSVRLTLGLTGWLPFSSARVDFGDQPRQLQTPGVAIVLGVLGGFSC